MSKMPVLGAALNPLIAGVIRALVAAAFGGLVAKGFITSEQLEQIVQIALGAAGVTGVIVWSLLSKQLKKLIGYVEKSDEVKEVIAVPEIANAIPNPKVVPDDPTRNF